MERSPRKSRIALAVAAAGLVALVAPLALDLVAPSLDLPVGVFVPLVLGGPVLLIGGGAAALILGRRERSGVASGLGCAAIGAGVLVLVAIVSVCILASYAFRSM